ncbi:hypothetical protein CSKR_114081 [Clonorchis sinensis]|uniref:Uncharacterized protein n=1 Tax=Clonorchis sinensis TaxID=79923 RepID=A0A419Q0S0_CLOSI|nr:hypothetical protein CSKR_114081 [Clonorchis sinensis]
MDHPDTPDTLRPNGGICQYRLAQDESKLGAHFVCITSIVETNKSTDGASTAQKRVALWTSLLSVLLIVTSNDSGNSTNFIVPHNLWMPACINWPFCRLQQCVYLAALRVYHATYEAVSRLLFSIPDRLELYRRSPGGAFHSPPPLGKLHQLPYSATLPVYHATYGAASHLFFLIPDRLEFYRRSSAVSNDKRTLPSNAQLQRPQSTTSRLLKIFPLDLRVSWDFYLECHQTCRASNLALY